MVKETAPEGLQTMGYKRPRQNRSAVVFMLDLKAKKHY
jgi:hypothetical protein